MTSAFTRRFALAATAAALATLAGCATAPDVRVQTDRETDLAAYRTFAFYSPLGTDRAGYQTIVSQVLKASARRELEARGLRYDEGAPQLLVNFNATMTDRLRVRPAPDFGYYAYRRGLYGGFPLWMDRSEVTTYTEGTLNIDLVDAARKQLVWEGLVVGEVTPRTMEDLPGSLDRAVVAALAKFPLGAVPGR